MGTRERRKQLCGARVGAPRRYVEGGLQLHAGVREHLCARERATRNARRARQAALGASRPRFAASHRGRSAAVGPKQRGRNHRDKCLVSRLAGDSAQPVRPARSRRRWQRAAARSARGRRGGRRCAAPIGHSSCARTPAAERNAVLCGRVGPKGTPRRWRSFTSSHLHRDFRPASAPRGTAPGSRGCCGRGLGERGGQEGQRAASVRMERQRRPPLDVPVPSIARWRPPLPVVQTMAGARWRPPWRRPRSDVYSAPQAGGISARLLGPRGAR